MKQHQVSKLTSITRSDLTPGQQSVQSCHAAIDFCFSYSKESLDWHKNSNYLISLSVADESKLFDLSAKLRLLGIEFVEFYEPDMNNELTAIAFLSNEKTKKLTSHLPLTLKNKN